MYYRVKIYFISSLPSDIRFHPPIGNGHVATNVLSDTIYMNGLFNGREDASSRARIRSSVAVDISMNGAKEYTLNMYEGMVIFSFCLHITNVHVYKVSVIFLLSLIFMI